MLASAMMACTAGERILRLRPAEWKYPAGSAGCLLAHHVTQPMFRSLEKGGSPPAETFASTEGQANLDNDPARPRCALAGWACSWTTGRTGIRRTIRSTSKRPAAEQ